MKNTFQTTTFLALALAVASGASQAALVTYELDYSGVALGNGAQAHAALTVDDTYFPAQTPNGSVFLYPGLEITDFSITVSNASSGNGTFHLSDYSNFSWDTAGANLNLSQELVGQATPGGGWASTHDGSTGDFNLFTDLNVTTAAPTGSTSPFQIIANNGAGDALNLTSFHSAAAVPLPAGLWLMASALAAFVAGARKSLA